MTQDEKTQRRATGGHVRLEVYGLKGDLGRLVLEWTVGSGCGDHEGRSRSIGGTGTMIQRVGRVNEEEIRSDKKES